MKHLKKINTEIAFLNTVYKYSAFVYIVCIFSYLSKAQRVFLHLSFCKHTRAVQKLVLLSTY